MRMKLSVSNFACALVRKIKLLPFDEQFIALGLIINGQLDNLLRLRIVDLPFQLHRGTKIMTLMAICAEYGIPAPDIMFEPWALAWAPTPVSVFRWLACRNKPCLLTPRWLYPDAFCLAQESL